MVMLLEGRHLQFFVHKKLDPSSSARFNGGWLEPERGLTVNSKAMFLIQRRYLGLTFSGYLGRTSVLLSVLSGAIYCVSQRRRWWTNIKSTFIGLPKGTHTQTQC